MTLQEQLEVFLNNHPNKENCITATDFKEMFLMGFSRQIQLDVEQFFNFEVQDTGNGNCNIVARLKQNNETTCHVLNEFFLKENFSQVKAMFGIPETVTCNEIEDGIIEI